MGWLCVSHQLDSAARPCSYGHGTILTSHLCRLLDRKFADLQRPKSK